MKIKKIKKCLGIELPKKIEAFASDLSHFFLRLTASALIMVHGWSKIIGYSIAKDTFPDPIGLGSHLSLIGAITAEFAAGLLLALGLLTRLSAVSLVFTMYVIAFIFHGDDPFNKKELALLYGVVFLFFAVKGAGKWSLDHLIRLKIK